MNAIDWVEVSKLAPGIAQVVIFVIFVLKLMERQDKRDSKKDAAFIKSIEDSNKAWQKTIDDRNQEWIEALDRNDASHAKSIGRLADEVKTVGGAVAVANTLITAHDQWEKIELERRFPERKTT